MKKFLVLVCALVLLIGCTVLVANAASNKSGYCEQCKATVTWEPFTTWGTKITTTEHKHYYIPEDTTAAKQFQLGAGAKVCLDLNGKDLTFKTGRAFLLNSATEAAPEMLSIQDSVGGATVTSWSYKKDDPDFPMSSNTNNGAGGVMWVDDYCTLNLYGGTFQQEVKTPKNNMTSTGGVIAIYHTTATATTGGTVNMYDGVVLKGGKAYTRGGTVDVQAKCTFNVYGGTIHKGTAPTGPCVNVREKSSLVRLYNDALVEEIYMHYNNYGISVDASFTGEAFVKFNTTNVTSGLGAGGKIANLVGGDSFSGKVYCLNGSGFATTVDGTAVRLANLASGQRLKDCVACNRMVCWDKFSTTAPTAAGHYHYYFTQNYTTSTAKQFTVKENITVCLDMNGKSYNTIGRALGTSGANSFLNVMDMVGGGIVTATGGNNNPGGGCVSVGSGTGGFNLYSGTLTYEADPSLSLSWGGTGRGGVIQSNAPVNIYGGKIIGGDVVDTTYEFTGAEAIGGAICAGSALNIYGGEITAGTCPETGAGPCIYMFSTSAKVLVAGDAKIDDIYFTNLNTGRLTVSGAFTGKLGVTYAPSIALSERQTIGVASADCDLKKADITCGDYFIHAEDGKLILSTYSAGIPAATGGVGYNTLQAAIDASADGKVELLNDTPETVNVTKDITLQLNGCNITGGVNVAEGATLYLMDSSTDDFTVKDGLYGKVSGVTGNVVGAQNGCDSYLILNESGKLSAHCVRLNIHTMTLRVDNTDDKQEPGIYYKSDFKADEKAAPMIATFGVALSVMEAPTAQNLESENVRYSAHDHFEAGALGNLGNNASTLLTGILKEANSKAKNNRNLNLPIYGRAYAKTSDGQVLVGNLVERSLLQQLQAIDQIVPSLAEVQVTGVVKMYNKFDEVLENQAIPGIKTAAETEEEGTLKVLVLGNSHGLDATNLLYEVFHEEAPEQKVVIAALYYSGCNMDQHNNYLTNNLKEYTYHKNDGTQPGRAWVVKDSTCLYALQDEQWDVIVMQQMNHRAGMDFEYDGSWKIVADYLMNNQDHQPKLAFHMTWTNPDDYAMYLDDNAPYNNPSPASWRNTHEQYWKNPETGKYDQSMQYLDIARCIKTYLVDDTSTVGRAYDYIIPAGTAVEYAQDVLGLSQAEVYRDYTHMNDYGRLITAYTWYATIMGIDQISEMNVDAVPANLKHKNSKYPAADADGNYTITQQMKDDLIESVNWALANPLNLPQ